MSDGGAKRQPTAFISHHSSQVETARRLKVILSHHGIIGWMAPDDINPGQPFDKAIVNQVRQSDLIILLFCEQSDQSRHVKRELMMAEDADKLIFPVRLEDKAADGLAYWLNDYQWIDWFDGEDDTITRMIETIKSQADEQTTSPIASSTAPPLQPAASATASAPPVAPAPAPSSGSQWPVPIVSAVIVALIMLVGFYFMTRDGDSDAPVETAAAETADEDASENSANDTPDPAPATTPPPMPTPITTPPPALPSPGNGDFYVVVGSFQPGDPAANQRASDFEACSGITPIVGPSDSYAGFAPGLIVVMAGGYSDARAANAVLSQSQSCVVDAFIRQAR
ncbi:toll/interleukin-1 receptor domain-containing protein [Parasphingopyxis sp. CP4]|uniref:toll/interleukin-1 receptor domain-containing protein n=1 Tax=Parasphingopyxis sp. CP4 TaxID=2724527 RepID=UPI0015A39429|nr:toll/interleukin-1 receptor domain-containing protein [Parasphingopyxis sp. CP4]QLC22078.1 toll/interleukin-1 receptor domain-containing protein [Parasphingopyxis sp. CP4]